MQSANDPVQGEEMSKYWYALSRAPGQLRQIDTDKIRRCLTFELTFTSFIEEPPLRNLAGATVILRHTVKAVVPGISITIVTGGRDENIAEELKYTPDYTFLPGDSKCSFAVSGDSSVFVLKKITIDLNLFEGSAPDALELIYDPGTPNHTFTLSCSGGVNVSLSSPRWREIYGLDHAFEFKGDSFHAKEWSQPGGGNPYAKKHYDLSTVAGREASDLILRHTPQ